MKNFTLPLLYITLAVATACSVKVRTAHEQKQDFNRYKTYCWLQGCEFTFKGPQYLQDSLTRSRFQQAIMTTMRKKGFEYNNDTPDLLLGVQVLIETDTAFVYHRDDQDLIQPFIAPEEKPLLKGTLVIDIIDQKSSVMVWRSVALSYFDLKPELSEKNIQKGVAKALKGFPPK